MIGAPDRSRHCAPGTRAARAGAVRAHRLRLGRPPSYESTVGSFLPLQPDTIPYQAADARPKEPARGVQSRSITSNRSRKVPRWLSDNAQRIRDDTRQSPTPHRRRHLGLHPLHGADPHTEGLDLRQTAGPTRPRSTALVTPPLRRRGRRRRTATNCQPGGPENPSESSHAKLLICTDLHCSNSLVRKPYKYRNAEMLARLSLQKHRGWTINCGTALDGRATRRRPSSAINPASIIVGRGRLTSL